MFDSVAKLYIEFDANGAPYIKGLRDLDRQTDAAGRRMESTWSKYGKAAGAAAAAGLAVVATAAAGIGVATVKAAATFEYEFSRIKANANATGKELDALRVLTLKLGKDTAFSAGEAAQGANELVKAGMDIAEVMSALPGMLDLAAAGELGVAQAAEITANNLNTFRLAAGDATKVADTLASAANKSSTDVTDLGMSLSMSATVAASAGLTIQETAAALALLANNGLKGSDAGTSLKSMFMQLAAPSEKARDLMDQMGLAVYDANGDMLDFGDVIGEVAGSIEGMTQQQRDYTLATLFGSDAVRTANILVREGEQAYRDMTDAVSKSGEAQRVAATKMDNLKGDWEEFKGSLETLGISLGTKALPKIREFVQGLTETVNEALETGDWGAVGEGIAKLVGQGIQTATPYIAEFAAEVVPQLFAGVFEGAAKAWWAAFDEAQREGARLRSGDASNLGYVDTSRIVRNMDEAAREYGKLMRASDELDRAWVRQSRQAGVVNDDLDEYRQTIAEAAKEAEEYQKVIEDLAAGFDSGISPADAWAAAVERSADAAGTSAEKFDASKTSVKLWAEELQKQIQAAVDFESNIASLMGTFGDEYDPAQLFQTLSTLEPVQVETLIKATPEDAKKVIDGLFASMAMASDQHKQDFARDVLGMGSEAASAASDTAKKWQAAFARSMAGWRPTVNFDVNGTIRINSMSTSVRTAGTVRGGTDARSRQIPAYAMGGWVGLPEAQESKGKIIPALLHEGEYVLTQNQAKALFGNAPSFADGGWTTPQSILPSFVSREAARYGMYETGGIGNIALLTQTLARQIEFLDLAVKEAEQTLATAKQWGTQTQINETAEALFNLKRDASEARKEMEALARTPLEQAASRWASALRQTEAMMSLVSNSSNAFALQSALFPTLMGQMGAGYQTSYDLMGKASSPDAIMGYANDAIGSLSQMFGAEQNLVNRALSDTLASIDSQEQAWSNAWSARADALDDSIARQREALNDQLENLQRAHQDELDALTEHYDDRLQALRDGETAITREQQRLVSSKRVGGLEDQLRILQGQGYYTEADIARMRELETQIQEQRDSITEQEAAWAREDERTRLQREQQEAVKSLQQQQEAQRIALQDQIEAQQRALDAQREAFQQQQEQERQHFEQQREQARQAAQAEIDALVVKYQQMMQEVINRQNELLGQAFDYNNAGYTLGVEFANGLLASLPAITAAAQEIATQVANILELHSPAKEGPLSNLDHWWDAFLPTLVKPLDAYRPVQAATAVAAGVQQVARQERTVRVVLEGNATGLDVREVARIVKDEIKADIEIRQWGR